MKQHFHILPILLLSVAFTACRKEIDLDLQNEGNKVVIEAIVSEGPGPHTVRLTRSVGFGAANTFPAITDAIVTMSDDLGNSEQLTETAPGMYVTAALVGGQQRTYELNVVVDGTNHTARCSMPMAVPLDALLVDSFPAFGGYSRMVIPVYFDPAGVANYYKFNVVVNGERQKSLDLVSDRFTDGNLVMQPLFVNGLELESGDVVEVTMECIAPEVYHYFFSMPQNSNNASTPADPVSNISSGALGYFSVRTSSTRTVVVP
ncbi:MAG TPA: DUF4249 domain-containing protein [Flavobacteriales bacterium]|nr:DUF4249 domain-containing protein [Flavobacteriales bacterium]HMR27293.1 DUF4249 domain-containing protein [Flavobacteriales bacterium]